MNSNNTFVAYAYLKVNGRPYLIFCNYICYAIKLLGYESVSADQIIDRVQQEFKIRLSPILMQTCLRILEKEKRISISTATKGISLINIGFNYERFERDRLNFDRQEMHLIKNLIQFSSQLGVVPVWNEERTRDYLSNFLKKDDFGLNLALTGEIKTGKSTKLSPEWYIGRYVNELQKDSDDYKYLLDVSHGLMIYIGVSETTNNKQEFSQKFEGTDFYLDTKLVLRALGLTLPFYEQSAKELFDLIRKYNKGNLKIFEHTYEEVISAISNAARELKTSRRVRDEELNLYRIYYGCDADDFQILKDTVREKIELKLKVEIKPSNQNWNEKRVQKNNLDWEGLSKKISKNHPFWNSTAVKNDVTSINNINILRDGDYTERFGGKSKLPIFVTTNTALIASIRDFISERYESKEDVNEVGWSKARLPIISEGVLLCRLWAPQSGKLSDLPICILAANAFAAQQAEVEFYDKMRDTYEKAKIAHKETYIDIDNYRHRKLEEEIITASHGEIEKIDETLVALSLDEILKNANQSEKDEIERLKEESERTNQEKLDQYEDWFTAFCQQFLKKEFCPGIRFLAFINKGIWPLLIVLIIALICESAILLLSLDQIYLWLTLPISVGLAVAIKACDELNFAKKISVIINHKLQLKFREKIARNVPANLEKNKEDIIEYCISHTNCFKDSRTNG